MTSVSPRSTAVLTEWGYDDFTPCSGQGCGTGSAAWRGINEVLQPIHDRMPVILRKSDYDSWLDPTAAFDRLYDLIRPFDPQKMRAYPVATRVNSSTHDDPPCREPA